MSFPTEDQVEIILNTYISDDLVKYFLLEDKTLTLRIDTCKDEFDSTITIPKEYPKGKYIIKYKKKKLEKEGELRIILENLLEIFEDERNLFLEEFGDEATPESDDQIIWDVEVENNIKKNSNETNFFFG